MERDWCNLTITCPQGIEENLFVDYVSTPNLDYTDKVVLDIGAANGDSASIFLKANSKQVIAVDLNPQLKENFEDCPYVIIENRYIETIDDLELLITKYKPEIVKIDAERCEWLILGVNEEILKIPNAFVIEVHAFFDNRDRFEDFLKYYKGNYPKDRETAKIENFPKLLNEVILKFCKAGFYCNLKNSHADFLYLLYAKKEI